MRTRTLAGGASVLCMTAKKWKGSHSQDPFSLNQLKRTLLFELDGQVAYRQRAVGG